MDIVETVARAIAEADEQNGGPPYDYRVAMSKHAKEQLFDEARAAIRAMDGARPSRISEPKGGWRKADSFTEIERLKLRPIAETLAMLDGNAFFTMGDGEHWWADQYLPEAYALYEGNGGDNGWASEASFAKPYVVRTPSP